MSEEDWLSLLKITKCLDGASIRYVYAVQALGKEKATPKPHKF